MPECNTQRSSSRQDTWLYTLTSVVLLVALLSARSYSYLLFHSLAEMITIAFAFTIFLLAWNTRATIENDYIKVISIGFAASAGIDLIHTLAFKGMNIFSGFDANLPTQLWINEFSSDLVKCERSKALHEDKNYFIFPHKLSTGEIRTVEVHSTPIVINDKPLLFSIIHDITERNLLELELIAARETADSANRAKSDFLANMSHELRNPMNGVLGMTQLLEMTELNKDQREFVAALKLSGKNLLALINDILDLSKIEAGKITIEPVEFNLRRAIDDIYLMQKSSIYEKKLAFNITIDEEIPDVIIGDQLRIKQIIHNLLGNAAKFTKLGSISIAAEIHERHYSSLIIQITITDTGVGISGEALDKIFKPFIQEDGSTTRQFGGTGLGLTISRRLAELMGGNISVKSIQGVGSSFIVKLPFTIPIIQNTTEMLSQVTSPVWDGPSLRILLAEDNPVNLKFTSKLLGIDGHLVVTAENGKESLEALEQSTFDLVLMDIHMPVMSGEEALRAIRSQEEGTSCHQKVIALTAHALRDEKERFLIEGFDGYLSKPMERQELIGEMKRVMNLTFDSHEGVSRCMPRNCSLE